MSNTDFDPFDNMAVDRTVATLDEAPEDAARAIDLGNKTGTNPVAIHADLEEYEANIKAATTAQIIRGNKEISDYINSHPLAGITSNGDLHKLDDASGKMKLLPSIKHQLAKDVGQGIMHLPTDFVEILAESGKTLGEIPEDITKMSIPSDEIRKAVELVNKEGANFHNIAVLMGSIMNASMAGLAAGTPLDPTAQLRQINVGSQDLMGGIMGIISAPIMAPLRAFLTRPIEEKTGVPKEFTEQVAMFGMMFMGLRGGKAHVHGGEAPPPGIVKEADAIRESRSKEHLKSLDEATKSVQGTQTSQIAPSLARDFVARHVGERNIHVDVEAIRRLYGEKLPEVDDGILGWVPGLGEELAARAETGGDIAIPLADWLTRVDPEVAKLLHDDLKVMKDDITINEAKLLKEHGEAMPKPALGPADMTRRGFLKGVGATGAAVATGKVPKLGEVAKEVSPFADVDLSMFQKNVDFAAAESWKFLDTGGSFDKGEFAKVVAEQLDKIANRIRESGDGNSLLYRTAAEQVRAGFIPSRELLDSIAHVEPYSEITKRMVSEDGLRPSEAAEIGQLPWPEEYMKGDYPKGLIEPGPRETMRRHQEAIDETRNAARLKPVFAPARKPQLQLTAIHDQPEFVDQAGTKHPAGKLHDINLVDEAGQNLGWVSLLPEAPKLHPGKPGELLYIDAMMSASGEPWQQGFGQLAVLLKAGRELRLMFPDAKYVGGYRTSGARAAKPEYIERPLDLGEGLPEVTLGDLPPDFREPPKPGQITARDIEGKPQPAIKLGPSRDTGILQTAEGKRFHTKSIGSLTIREAVSQVDFSATVGGPIGGALDAIARKVVEKAASVQVHIIKDSEWKAMMEGKEGAGQYDPISNTVSISHSEFRSPTFERTLLHEIVHAATMREIAHNAELETRILKVMQEAVTNKTLNEYGLTHPAEFIAEALSNAEFQAKLAEIKITPELAKELGVRDYGLVKTMWDTLIRLIAEGLGLDKTPEVVTALEAAMRLSQEAFDRRLTLADRVKMLAWKAALTQAEEVPRPVLAKRPKEPELPGMTRMEDRPAFETPSTIGITKAWYDRYQELIAKQQTEDAKKQMEIAIRKVEQIQTKEWKDNSERIGREVETEIRSRPDLAVDEALRKGTLGEGTTQAGGRRLRLNADELSSEQKAILDRSEYSKDGIHPDDLASYFGYPSGDAMLERLGQLRQFIKDGPYANSEAFIKAVAREETAKRMEQEFGDLGRNILEEARDHILQETQLDLMHEELVGLAMQAGFELSITKDQMKTVARNAFDKRRMGEMSTAEFLRLAGKHGIELEKALLAGDFKEAFRLKQVQTLATMMAAEAKKVEKAKGVWDRNAKRFAKRKVGGIDQRYTNAIHDILFRTGSTPKPRRSLEDLAESFRRDGWSEATPLRDFVDDRRGQFRELAVPDWILDPRWESEFDQMTTAQFREAHDAVKSLIKNGRDEQKVVSQGEAADLIQVMEGMRDQIGDLPIQEAPIDRPEGRLRKWIATTFWAHVNLESMMNRLDRGKAGGLFKKYIMFPIAEASNAKDAMIKKYQAEVSKIGKIPGMDKLVENNLFIDSRTGRPHVMRRRNVLGILQIAGDQGALEKLLRGHDISQNDLWAWLRRHTTPADWDRARKIGDIFDDLFEQASRMQHELSGVAPVKTQRGPFIDPHGQVRQSWHNPIRYDRFRPGESKRLIGRSALEEEGYYKATTPTGFLEERTGYAAEFDLTLDIVPIRMRQMIHDITMRPAVIQASKFFYNPYFERLIRKYYGDKPVEEFVPFLRDIANSPNFVSFAEATGSQAMEFFRQNIISVLIGWNPGTVMKHGTTALFNSLQQMGWRDFAYEFAQIMRVDSTTGKRNWGMALEKSEELQRRMRNFKELIAGHGAEINLRGGRSLFDTAREFSMQMGATPVAVSDFLSSVPTWLVAYKRAIMSGETEGAAITRADLAVRQTHGSSVMSNKPSIMRGNAFTALYSSLYGFFSHMFQKQYEMAWKARDAYGLAKEGELKEAAKRTPELASLFISYVIIPAVIEELVTPYTNSERDSWGLKVAKTLAFGISSSTIGVRDFVHAYINVRDPQAGLASTMFKTISDVARDIGRGPQAFQNPDRQAKMITHAFSLFGLLTGLTNASQGKMMEYFWRVQNRLEKPRGPFEVGVGLRYGTTKKHSKTLEEYLRHMKGH